MASSCRSNDEPELYDFLEELNDNFSDDSSVESFTDSESDDDLVIEVPAVSQNRYCLHFSCNNIFALIYC